ncbi:uncharacterized protein LOC110982122 isoform X2 [Acanthaster planci]|uniref:Uncharacterized protein LOC110982122 isoform X2 n=1 Tax=Acanthaster planci TaxID=133434 RepID=A0A8B7YXK9_ACAPL|nr:uncharacterized protein LOC110982122 isoform X2 [Acanthaster planci]
MNKVSVSLCHDSWENWIISEDGVPQRQFCEMTTSKPDGSTELCHNPFRPPRDVHDRPSKPKNVRMTDYNKNIQPSDALSEVQQYTCVNITFNLEEYAARNIKGLQFSLRSMSIIDMNKFYCFNLNFSETGLNYFAVLDTNDNQVDITFSCFCGLMPGRQYDVGVRTMPVDIIGSSQYDTIVVIPHIPPGCNDATKTKDVRCQKSAAARWAPNCVNIKQNTSTLDYQGDYDIIEVAFDVAPDSYCLDVYDVFVYQDKPVQLIDLSLIDMSTMITVNRSCNELHGRNVPFVIVHLNSKHSSRSGTSWPLDKEFYIAIQPYSFTCKKCKNADGSNTGCKRTFTKNFSIIENPCKDNPCGQHGLCKSEADRYHCVCSPGYMMWNGTCLVDPCRSGINFTNPCQHGECSYTPARDHYVCYCNENYLNVGKTCLSDPCSKNPETGTTLCGAHGQCNRTFTDDAVSFKCVCDPGFKVQDKEMCEEVTQPVWVIVVVSCVCGLLLFGLLFYLGKRAGLFACAHRVQRSPGDTYTVIPQPELLPRNVVDLELNYRRVLPIFSDDHPRHKNVVVQLCRFLQRHLKCEVALLDWQRTVGPTVEMWLTNEIEKADVVLLLCSKGTRLKYEAKAKKDDPVPINSVSEYGDVFVKALTLLDDYFGRSSADEKFIVAYFDYSRLSDIPVTFRRFATYRLMQSMEGLFLRIHGKVRDSPLSSRRVPSLERYQNLEMGRPLHMAIESMKELIRADASWYEHHNRRPCSETLGCFKSDPCEPTESRMTEALSWFFDENSSGRGSDADKYEELLSQFDSVPPSTHQAEGTSRSCPLGQAASSCMPEAKFLSADSELVVDSGFVDSHV